MSKQDNLTDFLTDLAGGIRTKNGTSATINPQDFKKLVGEVDINTTITSATTGTYGELDTSSLSDGVYHFIIVGTPQATECADCYCVKQGNNLGYICRNSSSRYRAYLNTGGKIDPHDTSIKFLGSDYKTYLLASLHWGGVQ